MKTIQNKDFFYTKLAFQQAEINLGSTKSNPSVGCVIVKDNSVISSGHTSRNGRPHAEANALKNNLNYKNSNLYVTLEPCSHYGKTPPCINTIIKKKINRVIFSINDTDLRSKNKDEKIFKNNKIFVSKYIKKNFAKIFYESYFMQSSNQTPLIDAKLALSKDYFTVNKNHKWITNTKSRNLGNFLRSKYDCLLTTSKTINIDDPLLNCRIEGLEKKSPVIIILDRHLKIKKNVKILKNKKKKIYIFTAANNHPKEHFLNKNGIKVVKFHIPNERNFDLKKIFYTIKKLGYNRVFVETGITFLNELLRLNLINNLYLFNSSKKLFSRGENNSSLFHIKKVKISKKNQVQVNLDGDSLYKVKL